MHSRLCRRTIGIVAILFFLAVMISSQPASLASSPIEGRPATSYNTFSGYVRRCPSSTVGIPNVYVRLAYLDDSSYWTQVAFGYTDANGYFSLPHAPSGSAASYRLQEVDPTGYTSCNAVPGLGGTKVDNNTIAYTDLMLVGNDDGSIFYDQPPNTAPNEERYLPVCLRALERQTFPASQFEVIVVDNASTDATAAVARRLVVQAFNRRVQEGGRQMFQRGLANVVNRFLLRRAPLAMPDFR